MVNEYFLLCLIQAKGGTNANLRRQCGGYKMSKNDISRTRTKHIDIRNNFARDSLTKQLFSIEYCPTNEMVAGILTKPFEKLSFGRQGAYLELAMFQEYKSM